MKLVLQYQLGFQRKTVYTKDSGFIFSENSPESEDFSPLFSQRILEWNGLPHEWKGGVKRTREEEDILTDIDTLSSFNYTIVL